jgi:hypothetical protein
MKLGTNDIGSVYLGTNAVQKVYLGTNEVWSSFTGLLDDYPNAAAAYSLRKLRSAYTGSAIEVRNDSGTHLDIGFVDNELDTATLLTHCGSGNGTVSKWYDQSGNGNNATQVTALSQPQIVSSGSVILENGKPSIQFDGTNDALIVWNNVTAPTLFQDMSDAITLLSVESAININKSVFDWINGNTIAEIRNNTGASPPAKVPFNVGYTSNRAGFGVSDNYSTGSELELSTSILSAAQRLTSRYVNNDDLEVYINNASVISTTFTIATGDRSISTNNSTFSIGVRSRDTGAANTTYFEGTMQELVLYKSNLLSDNSGINTNINDFYSIY